MSELNKALCLAGILFLTMILLSGCSNTVANVQSPPIYVTKPDIACMSRSLKQQILIHNEDWKQSEK